ncbi:hypothetical protein Sjap_012398 [Stephania japonica]|uniref:Alpha-carbonic anhydrase domain-containing protein n=1 Tax=Stephania japonica TaxID=461633 RepID=A0AAP0IVY4_9MAGN
MAFRNAIVVFGAVVLFLATTEAGKPLFSYVGMNGPEKWASLSPNFSLCSNGKAQAPINIVTSDAVVNEKLIPLNAGYQDEVDGILTNYGFQIAIQFDKIKGIGDISIGMRNFTLKSMHWHAPAEHTIDGIRYPLEGHLVHYDKDGKMSIVAFFYEYGHPDSFIKQLEKPLVELKKQMKDMNGEAHFNLTALQTRALDKKVVKYFRYDGSSTTPPCTEPVIWNLVPKLRKVSEEQVALMRDVVDMNCKENARPLQPLNGRKVEIFHAPKHHAV